MKAVIEGLLFLKGSDGMSILELCEILNISKEKIASNIKELYKDYQSPDRGIQLELLGKRFKLTTKQEHKEYYQKIAQAEENSNLSQSALETLAIIAYNGPITRIEIDEIRGVNSAHIIRKLLIKNLIEEVGKSDLPGKPRQYGVTNNFLDYFGLGNIEELPKLEIEETSNENDNLFESKYKEDIKSKEE